MYVLIKWNIIYTIMIIMIQKKNKIYICKRIKKNNYDSMIMMIQKK